MKDGAHYFRPMCEKVMLADEAEGGPPVRVTRWPPLSVRLVLATASKSSHRERGVMLLADLGPVADRQLLSTRLR